jgi:PIN domain nuclease of toxin-antitoxin system
VIHVDTHVVIWLYEGRGDRFPAAVRARLAASRPLISPIVRLELAFLHEIGRLTVGPAEILDALRVDADLGVAESPFERVAAIASTLSWTRDPFDRLIAAHAMADDLPLLTRDDSIRARCPVAVWD